MLLGFESLGERLSHTGRNQVLREREKEVALIATPPGLMLLKAMGHWKPEEIYELRRDCHRCGSGWT